MLVSQISVFLDNCPGRIEKVTAALSAENINIKSLVIADSADFSVVRIIADDSNKALEVLRKEGFTVSKMKLVGIKLENQPGALNRVFNILSECSINLEYGYAFASKNDCSFVILRVSDSEEVAKTLESCGLILLDDADLNTKDKALL